jgi:GNAT superfamily N-acetyltransferase
LNQDPALPSFTIEPFGPEHARADFHCGNEALDRYLKQQAGQDAHKKVAAPFVLRESGSKAVKGYYTLSMTGIDLEHLPEKVIRMLPRYPVASAIVLGRLAVDQSCRGHGAGRFLLADALKRSLRSEIAWVAVIVDAIDEQARGFYEHYGFIRFPDWPEKLFIMKKTVEQTFARIS